MGNMLDNTTRSQQACRELCGCKKGYRGHCKCQKAAL